MAQNKKRRKNSQIVLIVEILLCIIALTAITFSLYFLLKYNNERQEKERLQAELSVYQDPLNPYYSQDSVITMVEQARSEAQDTAKTEAIDQMLASIKQDLIDNSSSINTIRSLYPNEIVMIDENQYLFIPIDNNLAVSEFDINKFDIDNSGLMSYSDDALEISRGIDVSKFQNKINWSKVATDNIDYAIIRLGIRGYSEGKIIKDDTFEDNIRGAIKNGIDVGVYFFTQATSESEAIEEAQYVLDAIEPYNVTYPVVIDVETIGGDSGRGNLLSMEERTRYTKVFCDTISNAGYTPMIYGNLKTFILMLDMKELEEYPKWFAGYTDVPYFPYKYDMWQYTDSGNISGISEPVDINISFVNY